jgi:hypothetical protein
MMRRSGKSEVGEYDLVGIAWQLRGAAMRFARMERRKKFHSLATFSSARRQG